MKKVVVAHFAQQHSLETAYAVYKNGYLDKYFTTLYNKKNSLMRRISHLFSAQDILKIERKYDSRIPDKYVKQYNESLALILKFLNRVPRLAILRNRVRESLIYIFNLRVAKYVCRNNIDVFISYDTYCLPALKYIHKHSPHTKMVIDMSAPSIVYIDKILRDYLEECPDAVDISSEINEYLFTNCLKRGVKEIELADGFLVASSFTAKSLIESGVSDNHIYLCRYGLHDKHGLEPKCEISKNKNIRCIFCGNVTSKKGILCFVDVAKQLRNEGFSFLAIGQYDSKANFYQESKHFIKYIGTKTHEETLSIIRQADVLIFPTLADGYGFVVTEALSVGTPVICSKNAGSADLIHDFYNGFVVGVNDVKGVVYYLRWIKSHPEEFSTMIKNSSLSVSDITWDVYYDEVSRAIEDIMSAN